MKLTIVYNNEARANLKSGHGFSCLIENNDTLILFDTGCSGPELLFNLKELDYSVQDIDAVILSHQHWDHTGGLFDLLALNKEITVYAPQSFSTHYKNEIKKVANLFEVQDEIEIFTDIYSTGVLRGNPDEQSLILKTDRGITVIVGCSHPGVEKILNTSKNYGRIHAIFGGFHDFSKINVLDGIELIGACHCTRHIDKIREIFPKNFRPIKAGDIFLL